MRLATARRIEPGWWALPRAPCPVTNGQRTRHPAIRAAFASKPTESRLLNKTTSPTELVRYFKSPSSGTSGG